MLLVRTRKTRMNGRINSGGYTVNLKSSPANFTVFNKSVVCVRCWKMIQRITVAWEFECRDNIDKH